MLKEHQANRQSSSSAAQRGSGKRWEVEYVQRRTALQAADALAHQQAGPSFSTAIRNRQLSRLLPGSEQYMAHEKRVRQLEAKHFDGASPAVGSGPWRELTDVYFQEEVAASMLRLQDLRLNWRTNQLAYQAEGRNAPGVQKQLTAQRVKLGKRFRAEAADLRRLLLEGRQQLPQQLQHDTAGYAEWDLQPSAPLPWQAAAEAAEAQAAGQASGEQQCDTSAAASASAAQLISKLELHCEAEQRAREQLQLVKEEKASALLCYEQRGAHALRAAAAQAGEAAGGGAPAPSASAASSNGAILHTIQRRLDERREQASSSAGSDDDLVACIVFVALGGTAQPPAPRPRDQLAAQARQMLIDDALQAAEMQLQRARHAFGAASVPAGSAVMSDDE